MHHRVPSGSCWFTGTEVDNWVHISGNFQVLLVLESHCESQWPNNGCWKRQGRPTTKAFSVLLGLWVVMMGKGKTEEGILGRRMRLICNIFANISLRQMIYCPDSLPQRARNHEVRCPFKTSLCQSPWEPTGTFPDGTHTTLPCWGDQEQEITLSHLVIPRPWLGSNLCCNSLKLLGVCSLCCAYWLLVK